MDENNNETQASPQANPTNPAEDAVVFINTEVLSPPKASPMGGIATVMIEQSTGMMVQDLQSFLKGFEQVGLIALSRLANNLLTYGTPSEKKPHPKSQTPEAEAETSLSGNEMMKDLFKMVSDYAEVKSKISSSIYQNSTLRPAPDKAPNSPDFANLSENTDDPKKKNS